MLDKERENMSSGNRPYQIEVISDSVFHVRFKQIVCADSFFAIHLNSNNVY